MLGVSEEPRGLVSCLPHNPLCLCGAPGPSLGASAAKEPFGDGEVLKHICLYWVPQKCFRSCWERRERVPNNHPPHYRTQHSSGLHTEMLSEKAFCYNNNKKSIFNHTHTHTQKPPKNAACDLAECNLLSILKEINSEYSLEGLMLKLQYFGHLIWRANSLEKTLMLGKIEGKKRAAEDEMVGWYCRFNGQEFEQTPGDSEGEGSLVCCNPWGHKELDMTEWLNNNNNLFCSKRWSTHINLGKFPNTSFWVLVKSLKAIMVCYKQYAFL